LHHLNGKHRVNPKVYVYDTGTGSSYGSSNPHEALAVAAVVDALLRHGLQARDIAVLSPFKAQARLLAVILERAAAEGADGACGDVEAHTVDCFQGRDKACHLASSVLYEALRRKTGALRRKTEAIRRLLSLTS
jgi:hypothetical protein